MIQETPAPPHQATTYRRKKEQLPDLARSLDRDDRAGTRRQRADTPQNAVECHTNRAKKRQAKESQDVIGAGVPRTSDPNRPRSPIMIRADAESRPVAQAAGSIAPEPTLSPYAELTKNRTRDSDAEQSQSRAQPTAERESASHTGSRPKNARTSGRARRKRQRPRQDKRHNQPDHSRQNHAQ